MCVPLKPVPPLSAPIAPPDPASHMSPAQLQTWRWEHCFTQAQLGSLLGCPANTIQCWEAGRRPIPAYLPIVLGWYSALRNYRDAARTRVRRMRKRRADREIAERGLPDPEEFL